MKTLLLCVVFFSIGDVISAQPIHIGFAGQREIVKTTDYDRSKINMLKTAKSCGKYFFYEEFAGQKVITFKIKTTIEDRRNGVNDFEHIDLSIVAIKLDKKRKIPIVEYRVSESKTEGRRFLKRGKYVITLSAKEFRSSPCLSAQRLSSRNYSQKINQ